MAQQNDEKNDELDNQKYKDEKIEKESQVTLDENNSNHKIHLITIIGEIEGHENAGNQSKVTKYELLLPQLASIEDSDEIDGVLLLLNTMGGDVEAGLAIAEMVASLSKPTVFFGFRGQSQHRRSDCGEYGLFIHCAYGDDGGASSADEWNGNRRASDF